MSRPRVTYAPRLDSKSEDELFALLGVYRVILDSAMKKGSRPGAPDAAKGPKHDSRHRKYTR